EQRELLRHVADVRAQLVGLRRDAQAEHLDLALAWRQQPAQHADGGRLARAVRAEEAVDASGRYFEVDMIDRHQLAEAPGQAARTDGHAAGIGGHFAGPRNSTRTGRPAGSLAASAPSATSAR